jgi:hypothetical protein
VLNFKKISYQEDTTGDRDTLISILCLFESLLIQFSLQSIRSPSVIRFGISHVLPPLVILFVSGRSLRSEYMLLRIMG